KLVVCISPVTLQLILQGVPQNFSLEDRNVLSCSAAPEFVHSVHAAIDLVSNETEVLLRNPAHAFCYSTGRVKHCCGTAGRPFSCLLHVVARQAERAAELVRRATHDCCRDIRTEPQGVLKHVGILLEQISSDLRHFLTGISRGFSHPLGLLSRALADFPYGVAGGVSRLVVLS